MKKHLSIKKKLTIWYSVIIILVSTILFVSFYFLVSNFLIYGTDRSLVLHSAQVANSLSVNTDNLHDTRTKDILELTHEEAPGIFVQVVDDQGLSFDGTKSDFHDLSLKAFKNKGPAFSQTKIYEVSMRVVAFPIINGGTPAGAVIMGHQMDVFDATLHQLRAIGLLLLLFLIMPAILIGYLLAKSAIDPIRALSLDINKINSENLSRSVKVNVDSEETELLVNNFNSLMERLNKSFSLERQFLGEMAHEIKTPLAVIKSNAELTLSKDRSPSEYKQAMKQTLGQIEKLTKNLLSLMDFTWSQSIDVSTQFTEVNLSQLLMEIVNVAEYSSKPKHIKIQHKIAENISTYGKEEKLYQAIFNILDNAIKFTPEKGIISLDLYEKKGNVFIEIKDTGIGIGKEQQENIFNRFYRTEQDKNIAGHGLGLAIADSIVKAHQGRIEVESEKDKGSRFRIVLRIVYKQQSTP